MSKSTYPVAINQGKQIHALKAAQKAKFLCALNLREKAFSVPFHSSFDMSAVCHFIKKRLKIKKKTHKAGVSNGEWNKAPKNFFRSKNKSPHKQYIIETILKRKRIQNHHSMLIAVNT